MKNRRKRKITDMKTQTFIALEIMLHALLLPILLVIFIAIPPFSTLFSELSSDTHYLEAMKIMEINAGKWPIVILILLFIGFLSIIFSHHIAGPSLRFKKTFAAMLGKDFTQKIVLRRFDYLKEMCRDFNKTVETLSSELKSIKSANDEISTLIDDAIKSSSADKQKLEEIQSKTKQISDIVDSYKLG